MYDCTDDTWVDPEVIKVEGEPPAPRDKHTVALHGEKVIIFGGWGVKTRSNRQPAAVNSLQFDQENRFVPRDDPPAELDPGQGHRDGQEGRCAIVCHCLARAEDVREDAAGCAFRPACTPSRKKVGGERERKQLVSDLSMR